MSSSVRSIIDLGMDVHKESITIGVLLEGAKVPTRLERLPNDLPKLSSGSIAWRARASAAVRTYEIAPERFRVVEDWLTARRQVWEARLDRFDQYVKQLMEKESKS
jgi:hypothetical protein